MTERKKRNLWARGEKNIIALLIEQYDIQTSEDIPDALRDILGGTLHNMMEPEMDHHLRYNSYERN